MRQTTAHTLAFRKTGIQLTQRERDAFIRAGQIAEQIRERARRLDPDFEDDQLDLDLAHVEHFGDAVPRDGFFSIREEYRH